MQERIGLLGEAPGMLGFLFTDDAGSSTRTTRSRRCPPTQPRCSPPPSTRSTGFPPRDGRTTRSRRRCAARSIDGLGLKPRVAFGPLRIAISGRRVSPPLFESMEILGKIDSIARIDRLAARLA